MSSACAVRVELHSEEPSEDSSIRPNRDTLISYSGISNTIIAHFQTLMFSPTRETFPACVLPESKGLLTTNTQTISCLTCQLLLNPQRTHVQQDVLAVTLETYSVLHSICRSSAHHGGNIIWNKSTVYVPLRPKSDISHKKQHELGANDAMDLALK